METLQREKRKRSPRKTIAIGIKSGKALLQMGKYHNPKKVKLQRRQGSLSL
jgi:hypothetical protein